MAWVTAYDKAGKKHTVDSAELKSRYKDWTTEKPAKASKPTAKTASTSSPAQAKAQASATTQKPAAKPAIKINGRK